MFDWLFKPKPMNITQTAETKMSGEQQQLFDSAFPFIQQYASTPLKTFSGSGVAGFTGNEQEAQKKALGAGAAGGQIAGQSQNIWGALPGLAFANPGTEMALDAYGNPMAREASLGITPGQNPYMDQVASQMRTSSNQNLTENQLPAIAAGAQQAGGMYSGGSTRQGIAEGLATGRTNQGLDAAIADMFFKTYQQDQQAQLAQRGQDVTQRGQDIGVGDSLLKLISGNYQQGVNNLENAIQMAPGVQQQQLFEPAVQAGVGAQERAMQQAGLDEMIQKFYTSQMLPFMQGQDLMGLLQGLPGGVTTSTAKGTTAQPSWMQQILGAAAAAAGAATKPG